MNDERSQLGLDDDDSFWTRLGQFLATLLVGPLIGSVLFTAVMPNAQGQWWETIALLILEAFACFWVLVLIFIWWRPPWFRHFYLMIERKAILVARIASALIVAWFIVLIVVFFLILLADCLRAWGLL